MKTGLIKRLRNSIKDLYKDEPLLGNIFFNENNEVFLYDEVALSDAQYIDFKMKGLNKSLSESWLRFRRVGLLDNLSEDDKMNGWKSRKYAVVTYDEAKDNFEITINFDSDLLEDKVKELFNLN